MKNKFYFIISFVIYILGNTSYAESFKFQSTNIEIKENGNLILAYDGEAISSDNSLFIKADKFEYFKNLDLLEGSGNGTAIIKTNNIKIKIFCRKFLIYRWCEWHPKVPHLYH